MPSAAAAVLPTPTLPPRAVETAFQLVRAEFLTPDEVCELTGVTRRTLERWVADRSGPPRVRVGVRTFLYRRTALEAWLASREEVVLPRKRKRRG